MKNRIKKVCFYTFLKKRKNSEKGKKIRKTDIIVRIM